MGNASIDPCHGPRTDKSTTVFQCDMEAFLFGISYLEFNDIIIIIFSTFTIAPCISTTVGTLPSETHCNVDK